MLAKGSVPALTGEVFEEVGAGEDADGLPLVGDDPAFVRPVSVAKTSARV